MLPGRAAESVCHRLIRFVPLCARGAGQVAWLTRKNTFAAGDIDALNAGGLKRLPGGFLAILLLIMFLDLEPGCKRIRWSPRSVKVPGQG